MRVLKFHCVNGGNHLGFTFRGFFNPHATTREHELEPWFQILEEYAGEWMPDVVEGRRRSEYSRAAIWKALEDERHERGAILGFYRTKWPALDMMLKLWFPPFPPKLDITLKVKPLSFFAEAERCQQFVEMARAWASRYPVSHAAAHSADDSRLAGAPHFGRDLRISLRNRFDKIYEVSWLNVFGPKLVETVGRERMLSTPAWRVEELPNGSVLLVTWPTASEFASQRAREAQARAHVHLRPDLDFDTVLRSLLARNSMLAPVELRFHPDIAPLLSFVVNHVPIHSRQLSTAKLNSWHPPEPEEWRPSDSSLPPDVDDLEAAIAHYGHLAEHLVVILHSGVPSVFSATPESLTDIDFYFWREEFPTGRLREAIDAHAVPAIGAYLGNVLVNNLGGQWIPRRNLEEAQVLVGNRVWFPFLRARHYMRSRQALLDCSLTQLYRVAERHRG